MTTPPTSRSVDDDLHYTRALIAEANAFTEGLVLTGEEPPPRPFDQADRIPFWDDILDELNETDRDHRALAISEWEKVHGHDARLDCYTEYGCQAIESEYLNLIARLSAALEARLPTEETPE